MNNLSNHSILQKLLIIALFTIPILSFTPQKQVTWVAIGDSITYLNDHPGETGNRVTKGYLTRVKEQLPYLNFINQGHNGWTTVGIAKAIEKLGLVKADVYTVFLGTNDWWAGLPTGTLNDYINNTGVGTTSGAYRVIINKLRSLNSNAKIVLITPMQRNDFVYIADAHNNAYGSYKDKNGQWLEGFAKAVDSIGRYEKFQVVDLYHNPSLSVNKLVKFKRLKDPAGIGYINYKYPKSATIPFDPSKDEYPYPLEAMNLTYDGLHPSDIGNSIIAKSIVKTFKRLGLGK
jgi:lysophospholipase L1-like esterase